MVTDYFMATNEYDSYAIDELGIFIPVVAERQELSKDYSYPCYEIIVDFSNMSDNSHQYKAWITSPNVVHQRRNCPHCYIMLIEREYFEQRFLMYKDSIPVYNREAFDFCSDVLKALNMFVFEVSKDMMNSRITLSAQAEIITHWTIRSLMGETLDMRSVSSDYSIARAQHYIEQHYAESVTLKTLAAIGHMSVTSFNRNFKKEIGITPIEYLIEVRIKSAKLLLKRKDLSVTEVALRSGFGSASHFSSCFAERVGATPQEYRKRFTDPLSFNG